MKMSGNGGKATLFLSKQLADARDASEDGDGGGRGLVAARRDGEVAGARLRR